jgi:WD40 repeat protein
MKPLIILFILSAFSLQSQSISIFDIDTTNFPTMRAKFYAFDAAGNQTRPSASELTLSEDGVQRTITNVSCPNLRYTLSACIMVDTYSYIDLARKGAERFVSFLQMPPDEVGITYMARATLIHRDFTRDRTKANEATKSIPSAPGVDIQSMFYAEKTGGVPFIIPRKNDRKALILISDLHCPNLNLDEARLYADAKANGIRVFTVLLGTTDYSGLFKRVAKETNGVVFENVRGETQIYNVFEEIARKLTVDPCTIEWQSDATCELKRELELKWNSSLDKEIYNTPFNGIASLEVKPQFISFGKKLPTSNNDTTITITAKNSDFTITGINRKYGSSDFSILNTNFPLRISKNTSTNITVRFNPSDSNIKYTSFEIQTDKCSGYFSANGGLPNRNSILQTLKLTKPNGRETFTAGSDTLITWEGIAPSDTVSLDYSVDNGITWKNITEKATGLKYKWKNVPLPSSSICLVRITQSKFENSLDSSKQIVSSLFEDDWVRCISFSPDGSRLVIGFNDGPIKLWDINNNLLHKTIDGFSRLSTKSSVFHPDGINFAISNDYSGEILWDYNSGNLVKKYYGIPGVACIAISSDGKMLARGSEGGIFIDDVFTGNNIIKFQTRNKEVLSLAFSPDGSILASGGSAYGINEQDSIKLWDPNTGKRIRTLSGHSYITKSVAFSPDGSILASGGWDEVIKIWNSNTGQLIHTLIGHEEVISSIAFSPDGAFLASGGWDGTIKIWNSNTGRLIRTLSGHSYNIHSIAFSPIGTLLASCSSEGVKLWVFENPILQSDQSDSVFSIIAPELALKVNDIDMGRVLVGSYVDKTETKVICNEGTAPLHVLGVDVTSGNTSEFAVPRGAGDFFLAPGECQTITFQFSPTQVGPRNAKITVRSTIGDKVDSINIRGEGVIETLALSTDVVDMGVEYVGEQKDSIVAVLENKGSTSINITAIQYLDNKDVLFFDNSITNFDLAANSSKSMTLYFKPKEGGRVTGKIGFDYNGVGSPLEMLLFGRGIGDPYAELNLINQSAYPGEKISIPIILKNEEDLSFSKITTLSLDLEYNRTLLRPIGNYTPIVNGDKATIKIDIPYNKQKAGETLTTIDFDVALGNAQGCELTLSNPKSNDNNAVIYAKSGTFSLLGICEDGGARLINPELQAGIMSISPNPTNDNFNVEVSLIEAAPSELILLNSLGQQVMIILNTTDTGKHTKSVSTDQLSTGIYYLQLRTATYIENKVIRVER